MATTWIQQAFRGYRDETRSKSVRAYQIPIRGKSVREDGERGRDKIAEGKREKKSAIKMARCLLTVSTAIYLEAPMVFSILREHASRSMVRKIHFEAWYG